jgi:hypothetical protein
MLFHLPVIWNYWVYFMAFGHFVVVWYIFPRFGILYQEKSGNHAVKQARGYPTLHCLIHVLKFQACFSKPLSAVKRSQVDRTENFGGEFLGFFSFRENGRECVHSQDRSKI